jgi:hypothetical protein
VGLAQLALCCRCAGIALRSVSVCAAAARVTRCRRRQHRARRDDVSVGAHTASAVMSLPLCVRRLAACVARTAPVYLCGAMAVTRRCRPWSGSRLWLCRTCVHLANSAANARTFGVRDGERWCGVHPCSASKTRKTVRAPKDLTGHMQFTMDELKFFEHAVRKEV